MHTHRTHMGDETMMSKKKTGRQFTTHHLHRTAHREICYKLNVKKIFTHQISSTQEYPFFVPLYERKR